jgi:ribosomal protein S12 methylthiotransferase accessory factor YcaO
VQRGGAHVTVGPTVPDRDGSMRRLGELHDARGLEVFPLADIPQVDALVARRIDELGLQTHTLRPSPDETFLCVHDDAEGRPLVAFVMNPSRHDVDVTVTIGLKLDPAVALEDALTGARIRRTAGAFEVRIPARTARMFVVTL